MMGLVIRNAEKLGLHRDGTALGLSPIEIEERRRLWWQLQQTDLALAIRSGSTPLSLTADWDTKIPLNIEDSDLVAGMKEPPKERRGITSMSYCLWVCWVLDQQRNFFGAEKGHLGLSWSSNKTLSHTVKQSLIEQLEEGLNKNFIQYCDPIKPLDTLVLLLARSFICVMRLLTLHPMAYSGPTSGNADRPNEQLLQACMQALEYSIAAHSQPSIEQFLWLIDNYFPWHARECHRSYKRSFRLTKAVICVLVEASRQHDVSRAQPVWDLLSSLYSTNMALLQLSEDRRKSHAAELVILAWKTHQNQAGPDALLSKPQFIGLLETRLQECRASVMQESVVDGVQQGGAGWGREPTSAVSVMTEQDPNTFFELDFQEIDWSFWGSID